MDFNIEEKWQRYWEENDIFKCEIDYSKPKYYILDMFPYPSGNGLKSVAFLKFLIVNKYIENKTIVKEIYVPNKMVNLVVK